MSDLKSGIDKVVANATDVSRVKPDYNSQPSEGFIRLYHNTSTENLPSILKHGILMARPNSPRERKAGYKDYEGDIIWTSTKPGRGYGGNTIAFDVPKTHRMEKVNDDEYILYDDVKPENFKFVDKMFTSRGELNKISDLKKYVDIAKGQNKDLQWLKDTMKEYYPNEYLDDDEFNYWLDMYWNS